MRLFFSLFLIIVLFPACKLDVCEKVFCLNDGYCLDGFCECPPGFTGDECETETDFTINGLPDLVQVQLQDTVKISLHRFSLFPNPPLVTYSVEGLPAGVGLWFSKTDTIEKTNAYFAVASSVTPGFYSCELKAASSTGKTKAYDFQFQVTNCSQPLTGDFVITHYGSTSIYSESKITLDPNNPAKLLIENINNDGPFSLEFDCDTKKLTIPQQVINGKTYSGSAQVYSNNYDTFSFYMSIWEGYNYYNDYYYFNRK